MNTRAQFNVFQWIVQEAIDRTGADQGYVALVDGGRFLIQHTIGDEKARFRALTVQEGIAGFVVRSNESYFCTDPALDPHYVGSSTRVKHEIAVPLRDDGRPVGVLLVDSFSRRKFTARTVQQLETLAKEYKTATTAPPYRALQETHRPLSEAVVALAEETVKTAVEKLGADQGFLALCDHFSNRLQIVHSVGDESARFVSITLDEGIAGRAVRTRESQTWSASQKDPAYVESSTAVVEEFAAPILDETGVIGVLLVDSFRAGILDDAKLSELEELAQLFCYDYAYESSPDKTKMTVRLLLLRHFAPQEIGPMIDGSISLDLRPHRVTVLFADIRNFSGLAAGVHPRLVGDFIVEYYSEMKAAIHNRGGALDKYIGDGVMAIFGFSAIGDQRPALAAVNAALDMQELFERLKTKFTRIVERAQGPSIRKLSLGCALHTGEALIGFPKGAIFANLTAIGETINVAARLEKSYKEKPVRVSGVTNALIEDEFLTEWLGDQPIEAKEYPVYWVKGRRDSGAQ